MSPIRSLTVSVLAVAAFALPAAAAASPYYHAELAAPAQSAKVVAGGLLWNCEGTSCVANKDNSRPVMVCRKLAHETAQIVRFSAAGEDLAAEDLARCNG